MFASLKAKLFGCNFYYYDQKFVELEINVINIISIYLIFKTIFNNILARIIYITISFIPPLFHYAQSQIHVHFISIIIMTYSISFLHECTWCVLFLNIDYFYVTALKVIHQIKKIRIASFSSFLASRLPFFFSFQMSSHLFKHWLLSIHCINISKNFFGFWYHLLHYLEQIDPFWST